MDNLLIFTLSLTLIICVFGIFGNILCGIVLIQKDMKSSYIYLLIGLTVSDLFLLTLSTLRTLNNFPFFTLNQEIKSVAVILFFLDWICTLGTKYFTVAISLERYFAICHPLTIYRYFSSDSRAKLFSIVVAIFVVALSALSYLYENYIDKISFDIYVAIVLHFAPFFLVLVLNFIIYKKLHEIMKARKKLTESELKEVSVTKMLIVVVLVFGICYSFEFIRRILKFAGYIQKDVPYYDYTINHLADIFYVTNSAVNFVIYCLLGRDFRNQLMKLIKENICYRHILHSWSKESNNLGQSSMDTSATKYSSSTTEK